MSRATPKQTPQGRKLFRQMGFTLLEVLVAIAVTGIIAAMAANAFTSAQTAHERTKLSLRNMQRLDRAWLTIEKDLYNAIGHVVYSAYGDVIPAMFVDETDDEWLVLLRGGRPNPLHFYRSELARVSYKIEEEVLYREMWNDPANMDEDLAYRQKLMEGVEEVDVRILPMGARSPYEGPWVDDWPPPTAQAALPRAIEITFTLKDRGDIKRFFGMAPGL